MITADAQQLEPGGRITVYELDASSFGADQLFFHQHLQTGVIWWQGQEYGAWPIEATGFERTSDQPPNPRLRVSNLDGRIGALCLMYDDMVGARIIRRQTLVKYLDGANFPPLRNLLTDSSFETSNNNTSLLPNWQTSSSGATTVSYGSGSPVGGVRYVRVAGTLVGSGQYVGVEQITSKRPAVTAGNPYVSSVYARGTPGATLRMVVQYLTEGSMSGLNTVTQDFTLTANFQRFVMNPVVAGPGAAVGRAIFRIIGGAASAAMYLELDNAQFEKGTVATEYQFTGSDLTASRNPTADPNEHFLDEIWFIERKVSEDNETVEFELATAIDLNGEQLPGRQIIAGTCGWLIRGGYRGPYCTYNGSAYFDIDDNPVSDPARDVCAGLVRSCKKRFGETNPLPYGGFPAAGLLRS